MACSRTADCGFFFKVKPNANYFGYETGSVLGEHFHLQDTNTKTFCFVVRGSLLLNAFISEHVCSFALLK